jgi:hypothetical protein
MSASTETESASTDDTVAAPDLQWYSVLLSHPQLMKRRVFRSVSKSRAEQFIVRRYPRGSEAYLEYPDGTTHHFEHERTGEKGADIERWQPFDPESWVPPEQTVAPGQDAWADQEG